ncbi:dihydropteroate synthase [Enhygromyxa salina]|uniref:dihydropteroate synthase n=1 Tax=Enhygromyxa salina TaxID=215803 RepID=UPI0021599408|nr:dihydropteroate synthase [Enhygromyxa salina]
MTETWQHARGALSLDHCLVMAVVNATPDSFYDKGRWIVSPAQQPDVSVVMGECRRWVELGADILDVGGESTRPGATPVDEATELERILPIITGLRADPELAAAPISVDTRHARVAEAALAAGAAIVNDVSGLADPQMARVVAEAGAGLVIGHLRGEPATMQAEPRFDDLLGEVADELGRSVARAEAAGVARERIVVDPGVGFGKTRAQSAALVGAGDFLRARTGCPVLIGASRKRFLAALTGGKPVEERMLASVVAAVVAATRGAAAVRVHDVGETVEALRVRGGIEAELSRAAAAARDR